VSADGHLPASQEVPVQQGLLRRHMGTEQYEWRLALEPRLAHRPGLHAEQKIVWPPASAGPRLHCARDNYLIYIYNACGVRLGSVRFFVVVGPPVCAVQRRRLVSRLTVPVLVPFHTTTTGRCPTYCLRGRTRIKRSWYSRFWLADRGARRARRCA
jgi:hypothetical protein